MLHQYSAGPVAHRPSHVHLVRQEWPEVYPDEVCAVVVPASRPSHNLTAAVALAEALGCPLVVACSGRANVQDVARELDGWQGVAFAVPEEPPPRYAGCAPAGSPWSHGNGPDPFRRSPATVSVTHKRP